MQRHERKKRDTCTGRNRNSSNSSRGDISSGNSHPIPQLSINPDDRRERTASYRETKRQSTSPPVIEIARPTAQPAPGKKINNIPSQKVDNREKRRVGETVRKKQTE